MNLQEVMNQQVFVVVGDTQNDEKYAYKIKNELIASGYNVYGVGKELMSINDVPEKIDVIDLCIHPAKGLKLLQECTKDFACIVIQPGAESEEIVTYLKEKGMPFIRGCLLLGLRLYPRIKF